MAPGGELNVSRRSPNGSEAPRDGKWLVSKGRPSLERERPEQLAPHDRLRGRALSETNPQVQALFIETGLYGKSGVLLGDAAAKHRQVQHYLELLRPMQLWQRGQAVRVVDAGCGKAYLSLALYLWGEAAHEYRAHRHRSHPEIVGSHREAQSAWATIGRPSGHSRSVSFRGTVA